REIKTLKQGRTVDLTKARDATKPPFAAAASRKVVNECHVSKDILPRWVALDKTREEHHRAYAFSFSSPEKRLKMPILVQERLRLWHSRQENVVFLLAIFRTHKP